MTFTSPRTTRLVLPGFCLLLATTLATNCNETNDSSQVASPPVEQTSPRSKPAESTLSAVPASRPSAATQPAPAAQSRPAETRPETTRPASTYDSKPPYRVSLYVNSPSEKQPGWLRIEGLVNSKELGTAQGRFPEQNRIYVNTNNVRRLRIEVGFLPLRPNERVILQIDGHGMVISRSRPFTTLELLPTGEWVVVKDAKH